MLRLTTEGSGSCQRAPGRWAIASWVIRTAPVEQVTVAEHEVLVELRATLAVQVDVKELAGPQRLGDAVREVEVGHLLVPGLRVDPDDVAVLQLGDERERVPDRRQEDVPTRLV